MFIVDALFGFFVKWVVVGLARLVLPAISGGKARVTPAGESTDHYPESGVIQLDTGVYLVSPKTVAETMLGLFILGVVAAAVIALIVWAISAYR